MSTAFPLRRILLSAFCVLAALVGGIALGAFWPAPESAGGGDAATVLERPRPLPEFRLADGDGRAFDRKRLNGDWHLLFFGFTHCPDVCPATLAKLKAVSARLADAPRRPRVVFVSVDPERDDAAAVDRYAEYFDPGFIGVTGELDQIRLLTDALYLPFSYRGDPASGDYSVDHSAALVLIDPSARARAYFTAPHDPATVAAALRDILAAS